MGLIDLIGSAARRKFDCERLFLHSRCQSKIQIQDKALTMSIVLANQEQGEVRHLAVAMLRLDKNTASLKKAK